MNRINIWHHQLSKADFYLKRMILILIMPVLFVVGLCNLYFYSFVHDVPDLVFWMQVQFICVILVSACLLIFKGWQRLVSVAISTSYWLGMVVTALYIPNSTDATLFLIWLAFIPILVQLGSNLKAALLVLCATVLTVVALHTHIHAVFFPTDWFGFYAELPTRLTVVLLAGLISFCSVVVVNMVIILHDKNHRMASRDHLTGLLNRYMLEKESEYRFARYLKYGEIYYAFFMDFNHFKEVNDLFGHDVGDQVLIQVGKRLQQVTKQGERSIETGGLRHSEVEVYRFGGDEFVIILDAHGNLSAESLAETLVNSLQAPYQLNDHVITITVSLGFTQVSEQISQASNMIYFADLAMFENKQSQSSPFKSETSAVVQGWGDKIKLYHGLTKALENNELAVVYQPLYHSETAQLSGLEALLRWHSSEFGVIPPGEFIAIAEATGIINVMTQWVIEQALEQLQQWLVYQPDLVIAINISPYLLREQHFLGYLEALVESNTNLPIKNIELEITETSSLIHGQYVSQALKHIRTMGFALVLDDYGQGSTSFMNLRQAAFHKLKIDRQLLWEASNGQYEYQIIQAAVQSAHSLGLSVVAEGVENATQLALIRDLKCDYVQGFYFARPMPPEQVEQLLVNANSDTILRVD